METAICGRPAPSSAHVLRPKLGAHLSNAIYGGDKYSLHKKFVIRNTVGIPKVLVPARRVRVLRPPLEKQAPGYNSEFDSRKSRKISPPFRVLLHNDDSNKREYVVQVLMKVIPGMTVDTAVNLIQEAHTNGRAVVITCAQTDAEEHCRQLRGSDLRSSIEPADGGGC